MSKYTDILRQKKQEGENKALKKGERFSDSEVLPEYNEVSPDTLEEIETQIKALNTKVFECAWLIGVRLKHVRDLYGHIVKEQGYQNLYEYGQAKFEYSPRTITRFIFLAENFDKSAVLAYGSKLYLLERVPKSDHKKYQTWFDLERPSFRQIEQRIKQEYFGQLPGRPRLPLLIRENVLTLRFKEYGLKLTKEQQEEFKERLDALAKEFRKKYMK